MAVKNPFAGMDHVRFFRLFILLVALTLVSVSARSAVSIADNDISDHVEKEFIFDPVVPFNAVDVRSDKGIVTLTGKVTHLLAKERATRLAETVRGVRSVINRIEVVPALDRTGASLAEAVTEALLYDAATDSYQVSIQGDDKGRITLSGTADSWSERELAATVTKGVSGVTAVTNNIIVKPKLERPDAEIKPEIEKRLRWDALVDDAMISVRVEDGKVFLSGVVGSAAEKRRAQWDAWVGAVEAVDSSGLKVEKWARDEALRKQKYVAKSDLEIREAIQDALRYDPRVYAFGIDVGVTNGYVTLRGVVDNIQAKNAAERDAWNTVGVSGVNSLIKVRPLAEVSDTKIAANVRGALFRNPVIESYEIDVSANNGIVHLDGSVDSYFEKAEAENVAFRAKGVTKVRNRLTVDYPGILIYDPYIYDWSIYDYSWYEDEGITSTGKSDWEIERDIERELFWSPFVDSDEVSVSVEDGVATLTGSVGSWKEYNAARENAFEGGATGVISKLKIRLINDRLIIGMMFMDMPSIV